MSGIFGRGKKRDAAPADQRLTRRSRRDNTDADALAKYLPPDAQRALQRAIADAVGEKLEEMLGRFRRGMPRSAGSLGDYSEEDLDDAAVTVPIERGFGVCCLCDRKREASGLVDIERRRGEEADIDAWCWCGWRADGLVPSSWADVM